MGMLESLHFFYFFSLPSFAFHLLFFIAD